MDSLWTNTSSTADDYWVASGSGAVDPWITGGWTQHPWRDALGDYMKSSQSEYDNPDRSTAFYLYTNSTDPYTCAEMVANKVSDRDGTYGRKLFYEARGYTVTDCYNQKTDNNRGAFTFAMYRAEIDAGRPVMLNIDGHTMVGVGYDGASNAVYLHDTWDYSTHTMTWGGSYQGMTLLAVSVVNLVPPGLSCYTLATSASPAGSGSVSASPGPNCDNGVQYIAGTQVQLSATPAAGYTFSGWSQDLTGAANPASLTMDGEKEVWAEFTAKNGWKPVYLPLLLR